MIFTRILEMQKTAKNTQKSDPTNQKKQKTSFQKLTKLSKKSNVEAHDVKIILEERPDGKHKEFIKNFAETKEKSEKRHQRLIN